MSALLEVNELAVEFSIGGSWHKAVDRVSFALDPGGSLGVVGESGSGKSVSMMAILGLLDPRSSRVSGSARFNGIELIGASREVLRSVRGSEIALIPQDPMTSLDPVYRVGFQMVETLRSHYGISKAEARRRALDAFMSVGFPDPAEQLRRYPHELSGGMRQRVMIAAALACRPTLLIADEPTTALDVTVQAQIMEVLAQARNESNASLVMITHDLALVNEVVDRVMVLYGGRIAEIGDGEDLFSDPRHPYTVGLLASLPERSALGERLIPIPGSPPELTAFPQGCRFHPRCPLRRGRDRCAQEIPVLRDVEAWSARRAACHFVEEVPDLLASGASSIAGEGG